jgi:hypothetical protein
VASEVSEVALLAPQVGRKLYSFVHFEAVVPSTVYFLELEQDQYNGALRVVQQMVRVPLNH